VLSLRLVIFAALSGVALWGLFSLLDNLREPELLRSPKAVVVKGCDPIESDDAVRLCPQLICQKALLDARLFPLRARFEITVDRTTASRRFVGGVVRENGSAESGRFACVVENNRATLARAVDPAELDTLANQSGEASLEDVVR
jgi:hypothetical protein